MAGGGLGLGTWGIDDAQPRHITNSQESMLLSDLKRSQQFVYVRALQSFTNQGIGYNHMKKQLRI